MNAQYWELNQPTQQERAAYEARALRLSQIKEELARMMKTSQRKVSLHCSLARNSDFVEPAS